MKLFGVAGKFNDSYAFRAAPSLTRNQRIHQSLIPDMSGSPRIGVLRCADCGHLLAKWDDPLFGIRIKKRSYDISCTYDGIYIASEVFRRVYDENDYDENDLAGLVFRKLPDDHAFSAIYCSKSVPFDSNLYGTRFIKRCATCGNYESVVGAIPILLRPGSTANPNEFVRTDLEFGSRDEKSPLIICGEAAGRALMRAKLKGLELMDIERDKEISAKQLRKIGREPFWEAADKKTSEEPIGAEEKTSGEDSGAGACL